MFNLVNSSSTFSNLLANLHNTYRAALDIETSAALSLEEQMSNNARLYPHTAKIEIITVCLDTPDSIQTYVLDVTILESLNIDITPLLESLLELDYVLMHNAKYDMGFIYYHYGVMFYNARDTLLMGQIISNVTGSKFGKAKGHSLANLCRDILSIYLEGKGKEQTSDWGLPIEKRVIENEYWYSKLEYAANDVKYLFEIHDALYGVIVNPLPEAALIPREYSTREEPYGLGQRSVFDLEMMFLPIVVEMEVVGLPVSACINSEVQAAAREYATEYAVKLCLELKRYGLAVDEDWDGDLVPLQASYKTLNYAKDMTKIFKDYLGMDLLDNTQAQLLDRILALIDAAVDDFHQSNNEDEDNRTNKGISSFKEMLIDDNEKDMFSGIEDWDETDLVKRHEVIRNYVNYKLYSKQLGMDFKPFINPLSKFIHAKYSQLGAATGRGSSY